MKIKLIALLAMASSGANAAYIQAHDPHIVAPFSLSCQAEVTPPSEDINNPDGYYNAAIGFTGDQLKAKLNTIISTGHKKLPYTDNSPPEAMDVWKALMITDEDPLNPDNVILMYTGRSQSKLAKDNGSNDGDLWNREHTYPKSNGGFNDKRAFGYTDIHHLRPTDKSINGERGNLEFDEGGRPTKESPEAGNLVDSDSFEPRDEVKGDVARMMFYMATRYEGFDSKTPDLELVPSVTNNGNALGNVCALLEWNAFDPVDEFEYSRNGKIQKIQGNRNPFVDNPQWVEEIFRKDCK